MTSQQKASLKSSEIIRIDTDSTESLDGEDIPFYGVSVICPFCGMDIYEEDELDYGCIGEEIKGIQDALFEDPTQYF